MIILKAALNFYQLFKLSEMFGIPLFFCRIFTFVSKLRDTYFCNLGLGEVLLRSLVWLSFARPVNLLTLLDFISATFGHQLLQCGKRITVSFLILLHNNCCAISNILKIYAFL